MEPAENFSSAFQIGDNFLTKAQCVFVSKALFLLANHYLMKRIVLIGNFTYILLLDFHISKKGVNVTKFPDLQIFTFVFPAINILVIIDGYVYSPNPSG